MSGSEHSLDVYLGKHKIAKITLADDQLYWHYSQAWQQSGYAVSPHLPLHDNIPPLNVQRYLRNLLPEGNALDELISSFHLSKNNTFGLIRALGMDTSGSLVILPSHQAYPDNASFRLITNDELSQRLDARDKFSLLIWDGKPRLSVAGVQEKINVILNHEGQLGFGEGNLSSTHILKFEKSKLSHLVLNEFITTQLAKMCGLSVTSLKMARYGKHAALLVERFDRQLVSATEVKRRHMIDGCQALNLPPEYKYERNFGSGRDVAHIRDGASFIKLFEFANQCENPALTKQQMLDLALFNLLVFNYDAHGKNISFFVGSNGLELTPFYDLVNIKMYPGFAQEMAMGLGDEFDGNAIHAYQLAEFAERCQLPRILLVRRLKYLIKKMQLALDSLIAPMLGNNEEKHYLRQYHLMVSRHCKQLFNEVDAVLSVRL